MNRVDQARAALLASKLTAAHDAVREAFRRDLGPEPNEFASADIRVLCPRGHFIADVTVLAADSWPGITLLPEPRPESRSAAYGLAYEEPRTWTSGDLERLFHGRVRAVCKRSTCKYRGSFTTEMLAAELAEAAAKRSAEYRLTA